MQGDSSVLATSAPAEVTTTTAAVVATVVHDGGDEIGGGGSNSGDDDKNIRVEEGDRLSYGANRWPRQETLALLKIRSDMDSLFRDSSLKGPLWEEVSRKLAELGYHRSAKKCKEKFENVYKYHKRTKDGRTGKSEAKTYRFFDQLEAFGTSHHQSQSEAAPPAPAPPLLQPTEKPQAQPAAAVATTTITLPWSNPPTVSHATVPSTTNHHINNLVITQSSDPMIDSPMPLSSSQPLYPNQNLFPSSLQILTSHLFSSSTSSSTASDEEIQGSRKRKRRWKDFFKRLTKDVLKKQEELQRKFLETVERREQERIAREETWRMQELARINREHEILIQERTAAAAKDSAVIAFLQKISGQQNSVQNLDIPPPLSPHSAAPPFAPPAQAQAPALAPAPVSVLTPTAPAPVTQSRPSPVRVTSLNATEKDQNGQNNAIVGTGSSSSRWPKVEVEALIRLRTSLDIKYHENGPKGPLWEDISAGMQKLGYNRSAKRCKEKWENINKYFKKVKENNKIRPEDSKTCPYFHQLDALYKEKGKINDINNTNSVTTTTMEPLIVRPEQQWPLPQESHSLELNGRQNIDQTVEEDDDDDDDDEVETEEEDEGGGEFQVVASKAAAAAANPLGNGE